MEEARKLGMSVVAVGHQRCEFWGLRYLERMARQRFPGLEVVIMDEREEAPPPKLRHGRIDGMRSEPGGEQLTGPLAAPQECHNKPDIPL